MSQLNPNAVSERLDRMLEAFRQRFNTDPTAGARAPGRVDLMGSHTDYNEGFVLTLPIDRDTWMLAAPRTDNQVNIASLNLDSTCQFSLEPSSEKVDGWGCYVQGVATILRDAGYPIAGFDGLVHGTVPLASGLSSSASLEAATSTLFEQLNGFELSGLEKAQLCQRAENQWVGVSCGILDQYSSILGEEGAALLLDCRALTHQYAALPNDFSPVICNTCSPRQLADSEFGKRRSQCEAGAAYFAKLDPNVKTLRDVSIERFEEHKQQLEPDVQKRSQFIIQENTRVEEIANSLNANDRQAIADSMTASFIGARDLFEISVPAMQHMFDAMLNAPGCVGGRQAGAGFGGCMIALVESNKIDEFCAATAEIYQNASNLKPEIYPVRTAPGAGPLAF